MHLRHLLSICSNFKASASSKNSLVYSLHNRRRPRVMRLDAVSVCSWPSMGDQMPFGKSNRVRSGQWQKKPQQQVKQVASTADLNADAEAVSTTSAQSNPDQVDPVPLKDQKVIPSSLKGKVAASTSQSQVSMGVIEFSTASKGTPQAVPSPSSSTKLPNKKQGSFGGVSQQRSRVTVEHTSVANAGSNRIDALGRALTRILRHQAVELGLKIRSDGYCRVDELLKLNIKTNARIPLTAHSMDDVLKAVKQDSKQRFSTAMEDGQLYIRANQGHSIKVVLSDELLKEITSADEVPVCVHGTYKSCLSSIKKTGLSRMNRNHVHFATGLPKEEGVISGMRKTCEVLIFLKVKEALEDGMKLYISDNKVVLTEGFGGIVPCKYFEKIVEWPSNKKLA